MLGTSGEGTGTGITVCLYVKGSGKLGESWRKGEGKEGYGWSECGDICGKERKPGGKSGY